MSIAIKQDTCEACGRTIHLVPHGQHFMWQTNPNKTDASWHCGHDPEFPVKAHAPKQTS